jgi:4-amino-4-deoxy-L-arabinose transferase-like glycosyltransferase
LLPQLSRRNLLWVFALSLAIHALPLGLALANPARAFTAGDSRDWDLLARNLIEHRLYSRSTEAPFEPEVFRAPLYPIFVAAVYAVTRFSLPALLLLQAGLGAASAVLLYLLGLRFGLSTRAATLAALLASALPISNIFWAALASENLFALLLLLTLWLAWDTGQTRLVYLTGLGAGFSAGLMVLARPIGQLLLPVLAVCVVWQKLPKRPLARLGLAVVGLALAVTPWLWRNERIFGHPAISTVGGVNLLTYNAAAVLARRAGKGFWDGRYLVWQYWDETYAGLDPKPANTVEDAQAMQAAALKIIWSNPLEFAWVNTVESLNSLRPGIAQLTVFLQPGVYAQTAPEGDISPASVTLSQPATRAIAVVLTGIYGLVYLLSGVGSVSAVAHRRWPLVLGAILPVAVLMLSPGPVANSRFRVPVEPLLALLVVVGAEWGVAWVRQRRVVHHV